MLTGMNLCELFVSLKIFESQQTKLIYELIRFWLSRLPYPSDAHLFFNLDRFQKPIAKYLSVSRIHLKCIREKNIKNIKCKPCILHGKQLENDVSMDFESIQNNAIPLCVRLIISIITHRTATADI